LDTLAAREVEAVDYGLAEGGRVMTAMDTFILFFIHNYKGILKLSSETTN
jgi:hypothetical protein